MGPVIMDPGALTARLVLEKPVTLSDGEGGDAGGFAPVAMLWVRIEPVAGTVTEEAGAAVLTVTHRLWLRHRGDMASGMRFRDGTRMFVVRGWRDPDEAGRYLVCDCEETSR